jgi:hypothetical protein
MRTPQENTESPLATTVSLERLAVIPEEQGIPLLPMSGSVVSSQQDEFVEIAL